MSQPKPYEDLVLGSGAGGKLLAWHLARSGRRVAVVERRWIGGSCPNINCLPSKNEIWSAKVADLLHHAAQFGIVTGSVAVDMAKVRQRKREMVEGLVALHLDLYQKSGAELIMGDGRFVAPKTLEVRLRDGGTRVLTGERVFLNLGTRATIPPIAGLADARPLTNIEALELDRLPAHLIVLGGGYVGLEFAQAYRRFGSRVTVVEHGPQLAGREDPDVADAIGQLFADEGIEVLLSAEVLQVEGRSGESVRLRVRTPQGERLIEGSDILAATGRTPNTAGIGLDTAGVRLDGRGYMQVNDRLETSAPDVWAIGECAGSPQFTHVSEDDFRVIRDNLAGGNRTTRDRLIPFCLFTDPPLARVGLSETEARQPRRGGARREVADGCRAADADDGGDARLHEGARRRADRPHSGLHDVRPGGRGSDGRGADGDAGGHALHGLARRHSCAPDDGGRPERALFRGAAFLRRLTQQKAVGEQGGGRHEDHEHQAGTPSRDAESPGGGRPARAANWKRWGPYLSERQWGTVREDYSADGTPGTTFPHDHARSRAYRWGEDGLLGICDRECRLCFALALWNGRDPILKERLFGLTGPEGNHGEDVKECYFYLDSTPTHSYMKALYKYPQAEFPYDRLVEENRRRGKTDPEFELLDTGVFDEDRYFDVFVEYAKASPDDMLIRITAANRGPEARGPASAADALVPQHLVVGLRPREAAGRSR